MDTRRLPAAVLAAAGDRRGGAAEVAATALDGLLEVAGDPALLEEAVAVLQAGQPAMAPIWHLSRAARAPDPASALADLRRHLTTDADAAVAAATAWLRRRLSDQPGAVATVSHSSLVERVLAQLEIPPRAARAAGSGPQAQADPGTQARPRPQPQPRPQAQAGPAFSVWRLPPRWGSLPDPGGGSPRLSTAPAGPGGGGPGLSTAPAGPAGAGPGSSTGAPDAEGTGPASAATPVVGLVGADAVGPRAVLNAVGTRALAEWVPTLVVATAIKLVPGEVFERLAGPGFEAVPLEAVAAVVVGPEVLPPAEAGRRAEALGRGRS
jgi:hypothetical protein